jgi:hypothetical protein
VHSERETKLFIMNIPDFGEGLAGIRFLSAIGAVAGDESRRIRLLDCLDVRACGG